MPARAWPGLDGRIDTTSGRATGSWTGHPRQVHPNEGHSPPDPPIAAISLVWWRWSRCGARNCAQRART